ncbi:MAG: hypothetical protein SNJ55_03970 [Chloroherpetonaceae bacterium]
MSRKKIFFICGSTNQTTQMHQIAKCLPEYDHVFSPYYGDGMLDILRKYDIDRMSVACNRMVNRCLAYLKLHDLAIDYQGKHIDEYDLVLTCSDLVIPKNIVNKKVILVQEGMTDPENFAYHLVKAFPFLPRWIASTSTTGLSDLYDVFCVASEGYRDLFIRKGVKPEKIRVTGIPNFDNCVKYHQNDFPHKHFVLVCTSDSRETLKFENRKAFIERAVKIANGRQLIFKLHPNENFKRAIREIEKYAPGALVYTSGSAEEMIANCDVLITRFSSTVYVGMALGKEVYSDFDLNDLRRMTPIQNGGTSAQNIAAVARELLDDNVKPMKDEKMLELLNWINT